MKDKIEKLLTHLIEVEQKLGSPDVFNNKNTYRTLTQEHSYLSNLKSAWEEFSKASQHLDENLEMLKKERDPEFCTVLEDEIAMLEKRLPKLQQKVETLLVPPDPNDSANTIIELRAGTGGDEAALFVGDCVRMYRYFADQRGWNYELLSCTESEAGGYKEYIMAFTGKQVYRFMKYEGGTHRVQRVPETETQGRVHTSAITVAVLIEPEDVEDIEVSEKDLRVDTYRSSGAGGQHVNTTDSAVRLTHLPTGIVVCCQEERSQHKNKDKAMRYLKVKIADVERMKREKAIAADRQEQVGTGDRSERIRTYNFSQNRISDHRIGYTRYNLDRVMEGDLEELTASLVNHYHKKKLSSTA